MPTVDRTYADEMNEPPETVAVVGPPGCGKTTLIRSLVKYFTKQNLTAVKGPVTCIAGKQRRITFFECPNDVNAMCDIARVADLVLLVVDASFGFEMETFEFLNISKSHGFPKLIGVLTHLDKMKNNKQLKKTKKALRHRFWQEICPGAKLFYLSGMERNMYSMKEIVNLNRFIAVTKLSQQKWRTTHSCVLADRMEDITNPALIQASPLADRTIALYGYVRGCPMKDNQRVHIPGVGDYTISAVNHLPDPCALPTTGNKRKSRHLSERDKRLYAPMADVGGLIYDKDSVYIKVDQDREEAVLDVGEGHSIMKDMLDPNKRKTVDAELKGAGVSLFEGGEAIQGDDYDDDDDDADEPNPRYTTKVEKGADGRLRRKVHFNDELQLPEGDDDETDNDDDDSDDNEVILPSDRKEAISHNISSDDLRGMSLLGDDDDDILFKVQGSTTESAHQQDITRDVRAILEEDWEVETIREGIRDLFVTGEWTAEESTGIKAAPTTEVKNNKGYESVSEGDSDNEQDLMDLDDGETDDEEEEESNEDDSEQADETDGEPKPKKKSKLETLQDSVRSLVPDNLRINPNNAKPPEPEPKPDEAGSEDEDDEYKKKKIAKKKAFDAAYDNVEGGKPGETDARDFLDSMKQEMDKKHEKTKTLIEDVTVGNIEEKIKLVGYYAGLYVRVVIEGVPAEFVSNFQPKLPLVLGGLLASEDRLGVVYMRIKKHRWYPKILKAGDPLVLSVGWRRFQTQPIFALEDPNGRNRYLKYSPLHMHCVAAFYGPVTPPNTGVIAFTNNSLQPDVRHFRCSATGYIMEIDHSSRIVKKLKLTGVPAKVYKNTAFIKNMFSSALEVAKFEGAKIQTTSGLRGTVKRAVTGKNGIFRATFEDKISKADIIFCKTWKVVEPQKYYNPVTNLLLKEWVAMKNMTELRRDRGIAVPYSVDSIYREVKRGAHFNRPLQAPAKLEGSLPFDKKKLRFIEKDGMSKSDSAIAQETAFVLEPKAQAARDVLEKLTLVDNIKKRKEKENAAEKKKSYLREKAKKDEKSIERLKALKKKNSKLAEFKNTKRLKTG
eukprot:TRINITY_DN1643_c1_g1_i1.p1 TRINITY_DN1643_c1_g1~~TRINITY_DN1643_c1_g1_i1.p1  ORF type:complete len:1063 (+),score=272.75 TRINITY_DN1643_c1_g1_i1:373-3561(+)